MPTIAEQLDNLARLQVLMQHSCTSARKVLAQDELVKLEKQFGGPLTLSRDMKLAKSELRWRNYQQLQLESDVTNDIYDEELPTKNLLFILIAKHFAAQEKANEQPPKAKALKEFIQKQKELIFNQYLAQETREYLENFMREPDQEFSPQEILDNATKRYKLEIYKFALLECEVVNLVGYYARLRNRSTRSSTEEETIEKLLCITKEISGSYSSKGIYDFAYFKFEEIRKLYSKLEDKLSDITAENVGDVLERVLRIDSLKLFPGSNIFASHIVNLTPQKALSTVLKTTELMMATITIPEIAEIDPIIPEQEVMTSSIVPESIQSLRAIAANYSEYLEGIIKEEEIDYPNRKPGAVDKRRVAIDTIIYFANHETELTPLLKKVVKASVDEIKDNEPTWFEKSLLDQILDIIFARPLFRSIFASKPEAQTALYQQSETLNPKDNVDDSDNKDESQISEGP